MSTEIVQPYDAQDARRQRGLEIAATSRLVERDGDWIVPSQNGPKSYRVNIEEQRCDCPDYESRQLPCKHLIAAEIVYKRETKPDGTVVESKTVRMTYAQPWHLYNEAQMAEERLFGPLLQSLCAGIEQPVQTFGRPRLPLADVVYALVSRAYAGKSGRRFTSRLAEAQDAGLVTKAPHYNSAFRYLENESLTPLLKQLIEVTAAPLKAIEQDFTIDSSGFATSTYARWFDHKWGKVRSEAHWVKAHVMSGTLTNIVTSVEATNNNAADAPFLPPLLERTAKTFDIHEVTGDKAYSSRKNLRAVDKVGGVAYIPFKARTTGSPTSNHHAGYDGLWSRMWHYYQYNRAEFLTHYHKRSNAETVFSSIKRKFGQSVRAKTPTAQINEVLSMFVAYNVCVLIDSIFTLNIEPVFWATIEADQASAPKLPHISAF